MLSPKSVVRRFLATSQEWREAVAEVRTLANETNTLLDQSFRQEASRKKLVKNTTKLEKALKWVVKEIPGVDQAMKKVYRDPTIDNSMVLEGEIADLEMKREALVSLHHWVTTVMNSIIGHAHKAWFEGSPFYDKIKSGR